MAITERYANFALGTGSNNGTSEANAWQTPAAMEAGVVAGDRVNMKFASRYTLAGSQTFTFAGSITQPIYLRGYTSTIGDGGKILLHFPASFYTWIFNGDNVIADAWDITDASPISSVPFQFLSDGGFTGEIKFVSTTTGTHISERIRLDDCVFNSIYVESAGNNSSTQAILRLNRCEGGSVAVKSINGQEGIRLEVGFRTNSISDVLVYSLVSTTKAGIAINGGTNGYGCMVRSFTIDGFDYGVTVDELPAATGFPRFLVSGIISGASTGIINNGTNKTGFVMNEVAFYNCTTDISGWSDNEVLNKISVTADPFTDSANEDFSLNDTAGGGALLKDAKAFAAGVI